MARAIETVQQLPYKPGTATNDGAAFFSTGDRGTIISTSDQYDFAITTRRSTSSPVTIALPCPAVFIHQRDVAHRGFEFLETGVACRVVFQMRHDDLPPPFSAVTAQRISSTSPMESAFTVFAFSFAFALL
jgi:hypothetical protein